MLQANASNFTDPSAGEQQPSANDSGGIATMSDTDNADASSTSDSAADSTSAGSAATLQAGLPLTDLDPARRLLVVGDEAGTLTTSVKQAIEGLEGGDAVTVEVAATPFDALADYPGDGWAAVLLHVGPIQQRPGPAVQAMREQLDLGAGRNDKPGQLILFGDPGSEPLCRRLLAEGADAFILLPVDVPSLRAMLTPILGPAKQTGEPSPQPAREVAPASPDVLLPADLLSATDVIDAMTTHPANAVARVVDTMRSRLSASGNRCQLSLVREPLALPGNLSTPIRPDLRNTRHLVLTLPPGTDDAERDVALHELSLIAADLGRLAELEARHAQLQKLALSDDLTGCANKRYFRHFLDKILERAKAERFPVTLLLFDIDDFKHYNDAHGHRIGDAILRQTAALIKRCVRDHDLVARIGGDEFAVVFWEKDDPRVPRDPSEARGRFPDAPLLIAQRFKTLLSDPDHSEFAALGARGAGELTISGGMAVFPYDGQTSADLIEAADRALLFHAKRDGKNSIALVGNDAAES
ncbi:MAG: GGDEF domain-containing protein [Planctomycetota bacterium]